MKTNIDIPSLTQACKHIYRDSQIPQAWTHPSTSTLKYCYITYCKTWKSSQIHFHKCFCCSVTQSCLTLCGPMDRSTLGFPVLFLLPEFAQTHVHWVSDAIQPSYLLSSPSLQWTVRKNAQLFQDPALELYCLFQMPEMVSCIASYINFLHLSSVICKIRY